MTIEDKPLTQSEYIKIYCKNSGITEEKLLEIGLCAIPCNCSCEDCG